MDKLVKSGIELDHAYSYKFCSPTRSCLQVGQRRAVTLNHAVGFQPGTYTLQRCMPAHGRMCTE